MCIKTSASPREAWKKPEKHRGSLNHKLTNPYAPTWKSQNSYLYVSVKNAVKKKGYGINKEVWHCYSKNHVGERRRNRHGRPITEVLPPLALRIAPGTDLSILLEEAEFKEKLLTMRSIIYMPLCLHDSVTART